MILKGAELDTNYGHFLVYGVTEELTERVDFSRVGLDAIGLLRAADDLGGIAIPAHPGRFGIGLCEYIDNGADFSPVKVVEHLNAATGPGSRSAPKS